MIMLFLGPNIVIVICCLLQAITTPGTLFFDNKTASMIL